MPLWGQRTIQALRPPLGFRPHPFPVGRHGIVTALVEDHSDRVCVVPRLTSSNPTLMKMTVRIYETFIGHIILLCDANISINRICYRRSRNFVVSESHEN